MESRDEFHGARGGHNRPPPACVQRAPLAGHGGLGIRILQDLREGQGGELTDPVSGLRLHAPLLFPLLIGELVVIVAEKHELEGLRATAEAMADA